LFHKCKAELKAGEIQPHEAYYYQSSLLYN